MIPCRSRGYRNGEIVAIGWALAALAAVGGVAFLVKMAYWKPKKRKRFVERRKR